MHPLSRLLLATLLSLDACAAGAGTSADQALRVGQIELGSGATEGALHIAEGLAAERPDDPGRLILLGQADLALDRLDPAMTAFQSALRSDPGSIDAAFGLARLHLKTDPREALEELRVLSGRVPRDARIQTDLGVAYDLAAEPTAAETAYRRAINLDPSLVSAQVDLGLSLAISGHPSEALAILGPLAEPPDASPRVRQDYAVAASLAGHQDAARTVLTHDLPVQDADAEMVAYQAFRDEPLQP